MPCFNSAPICGDNPSSKDPVGRTTAWAETAFLFKRFPCPIRFYSNPCKHNWCKHLQHNHSYENIWLKNLYQKKNGEVKEILNSNKREWFLAVFSVRQDKRVCFSVSRYLLSFCFAFSRKEILDSNTWTIDVEYLWQPLHSETQFLRALLSLPRGADLYSKVDSTNSGKTRPTPRTSSNDLVWFYELAE